MENPCGPGSRPDSYPVFLNLAGRVCLIVGGGKVGERKAKRLLDCGANVRIVAGSLTGWLQEECAEGRIEHIAPAFSPEQLDGVALVFAATSDPDLNMEVARASSLEGIWVNMATDPSAGSFTVPSLIRRGPLSVALGTGGMSPALSARLRVELEALIGPEWPAFIHFMGLLRAAIQTKRLGTDENQRIFREVAGLQMPAWLRSGSRDEAIEAVYAACGTRILREELSRMWDEVWTHCCLSSPPCATASGPSDT